MNWYHNDSLRIDWHLVQNQPPSNVHVHVGCVFDFLEIPHLCIFTCLLMEVPVYMYLIVHFLVLGVWLVNRFRFFIGLWPNQICTAHYSQSTPSTKHPMWQISVTLAVYILVSQPLTALVFFNRSKYKFNFIILY